VFRTISNPISAKTRWRAFHMFTSCRNAIVDAPINLDPLLALVFALEPPGVLPQPSFRGDRRFQEKRLEDVGIYLT
jgi:hypothetical protein